MSQNNLSTSDLFDDFDLVPNNQNLNEPSNNNVPNTPNSDFFLEVLKNNGIGDKINYDGTEIEIKDLTYEDKLDLLGQILLKDVNLEPSIPKEDLELLAKVKEIGLDNFTSTNTQQQKFTIDSIQDDELFVADLKVRYPDLSEEDLQEQLDLAKSNKLYPQIIQNLKEEYKKIELAQQEAEEEESLREQELLLEEQRKTIVEAVYSVNDVMGAEISDEIKEDLLEELLEIDPSDEEQESIFINKVLKDPKTMFKVAFFLKYGDDVLNSIHTMYKEEINKLKNSKQNFTRNPQNNNNASFPKNEISINDLFSL